MLTKDEVLAKLNEAIASMEMFHVELDIEGSTQNMVEGMRSAAFNVVALPIYQKLREIVSGSETVESGLANVLRFLRSFDSRMESELDYADATGLFVSIVNQIIIDLTTSFSSVLDPAGE